MSEQFPATCIIKRRESISLIFEFDTFSFTSYLFLKVLSYYFILWLWYFFSLSSEITFSRVLFQIDFHLVSALLLHFPLVTILQSTDILEVCNNILSISGSEVALQTFFIFFLKENWIHSSKLEILVFPCFALQPLFWKCKTLKVISKPFSNIMYFEKGFFFSKATIYLSEKNHKMITKKT